MSTSSRSTNFTKKAQWRAKGRTSFWKWPLEDCNSSSTSWAKSISALMMSWNSSNSSILRLKESQSRMAKRTKMMLELSWREFRKMVKALRKEGTRRFTSQWTRAWTRQLCCQIYRSKHPPSPTAARNSKVMQPMTLSFQLSKAFRQEIRTKIDFSRPSTTEPIQMQWALGPIWLADMLRELFRLRIWNSVSSLTSFSPLEWPSLK